MLQKAQGLQIIEITDKIMALRDQPYIPLYIQDIMTDEKLNECSASAAGVYIKGYMCLMHKSKDYGKILLQQKDKQSGDQVLNFAAKIAKHLPYSEKVIYDATLELLTEKVLFLDGDFICQKRMIHDNEVSLKRSKSGKAGVESKNSSKPKSKKKNFATAKDQANSEYENEYENEFSLGFVNDSFKENFLKFLEFRKKTKKPFTQQQSVEAFYRELMLLSNANSEIAGKIIDRSIANEWLGIYKLESNGKQSNTEAHLTY